MSDLLPRTSKGQFIAGITYYPETMFKPGQEPLNKGKKFPGTGNKASFKKGNEPHNTLYNQATRVRKNNQGRSYLYIRISKSNWEFMQKWRWMNEVGPIPEGMLLRCINGDTLNCDPANWKLITRAENARLNRHECDLKTATCEICNHEFKTRTKKAKYCSDECRIEANRKYMHNRYKKVEREIKPNLSPKVKICIVCENAYLPVSNGQKTCSDSCSTIQRFKWKQKYVIEHKKVNSEKHCSKCGQKFTPEYAHRTICDTCKTSGPRTVKCIQCGTEFTSTGRGVKLLCSDECRRMRKNLKRATFGFNPNQITKTPQYCCAWCNTNFESQRKVKYCSDNCRNEFKRKHQAEYNAAHKKPPKVKLLKKLKKVVPQKLNKRNPKAEKDAALNMLELNRNAPKHDGEIIKAKQIASPDLSKMEFRIYDKRLKQTFFFRTEERYLNYLNKLKDAEAR